MLCLLTRALCRHEYVVLSVTLRLSGSVKAQRKLSCCLIETLRPETIRKHEIFFALNINLKKDLLVGNLIVAEKNETKVTNMIVPAY